MGVESVAEIYRSQIAEYNSKAAERKSGWEKIGNTVKAAGEDALSFQECMKNAAVRQTEGNETAVKETTAKETGTKGCDHGTSANLPDELWCGYEQIQR